MEVPAQDVQARAGVDVPHAARAVVAAAHDAVPARVEAAHALRVALEHAQQAAALDVPHAQRAIPRSRHRDRAPVQDLETANCGRVPAQDVDAVSTRRGKFNVSLGGREGKGAMCLPRLDVPDAQFLVAPAAHDQGVGLAPPVRRAARIARLTERMRLLRS